MANQGVFIKAVAEILLVGDWHKQAMAERIYWLLQSRPAGIIPLVNDIYTQFKSEAAEVTEKQISLFIRSNHGFLETWPQLRQQIHLRQFNLEPIPTHPAKLVCDIPVLDNVKQLSQCLGLSFGQLENYAANWRISNQSDQFRHHHYHYHWVKKSTGQNRLIEAPKQRMADAQRQIYDEILQHIPLHHSCHGFRKNHSCRSYVEPHSGKNSVLHMDLQGFFTSIPLRRIHALFITIGYRESVARLLAGLCCHQTPIDIINENQQLNWQQRKQLMTPHLPQGSPSSPALANLAAYKLDVRLDALAKKMGADYTRYADDLAFSGNAEFSRVAKNLPVLVAHIALTEGFSVNHRKTKLMRQSVSQRLTGMTLNSFPNIPRKDYDELKAILYNCIKFGYQSQNRKQLPDFKAHLQGRIAFVRSLNLSKAEKLEKLYRQINWSI